MTGPQLAGEEQLRYTSAPQRREEILRRMRRTGYVSAPELSAKLSVSDRTVRRDLQRLADLGLAELVYGGAVPPGGVQPGSPFGARSQVQSRQKRAIAHQALQFVEPGATIGIDAGTTTLELARLLPPDGDITVVTHSLPAMAALGERSDVALIGLGGLLHPATQAFTGPDTVTAVSRLRVHTFFLAASGLTGGGAYCSTPLDAEAKRAFIAAADRVVLLADSSKLRQTAPVPICDYVQLDAVITDAGATDADRAQLASVTSLLIAVG
ncbi:DeoR/GlpR family DNA-binding transcription regulator [Micromonospora sp. WMMD812]|uniref:DeoR/GlpR family DNA-binding transcription regulator n=1 Tax=Micromonospora sp. WMMD812 TaxID=3015152 RepID=UPI00248BA881|nr:DeoR/GlpR family DNA-binding transcription regulator [Micromonospora sp. WMMD812]WBB69206.1 DeoR/GlpR family DNA-binding transcription regulator [Micromonospora sp. WMMD812]